MAFRVTQLCSSECHLVILQLLKSSAAGSCDVCCTRRVDKLSLAYGRLDRISAQFLVLILHAVRNDAVDFLAIVPSPPQLIIQLYTFSTGERARVRGKNPVLSGSSY